MIYAWCGRMGRVKTFTARREAAWTPFSKTSDTA